MSSIFCVHCCQEHAGEERECNGCGKLLDKVTDAQMALATVDATASRDEALQQALQGLKTRAHTPAAVWRDMAVTALSCLAGFAIMAVAVGAPAEQVFSVANLALFSFCAGLCGMLTRWLGRRGLYSSVAIALGVAAFPVMPIVVGIGVGIVLTIAAIALTIMIAIAIIRSGLGLEGGGGGGFMAQLQNAAQRQTEREQINEQTREQERLKRAEREQEDARRRTESEQQAAEAQKNKKDLERKDRMMRLASGAFGPGRSEYRDDGTVDHFDEDGRHVGSTKGDPYGEVYHYDHKGGRVGSSRRESSLLFYPSTEHYSWDGKHQGSSILLGGLLDHAPHMEHFDTDGNLSGKSYKNHKGTENYENS